MAVTNVVSPSPAETKWKQCDKDHIISFVETSRGVVWVIHHGLHLCIFFCVKSLEKELAQADLYASDIQKIVVISRENFLIV